MKVIYYAHSLLSRGGDKMVLAHAGWLAAHGHEVVLCCNVVDTVLEVPAGVQITRPELPGRIGTVLSAVFGRREADVVLASIIPMACFLFLRSGRKVIYFAQDYDVSYYSSLLLKGLLRLFYHLGLSIFRIPTIAVSQPLADLLGERFHVNVAVAENGVDDKVFFPDPDPALVAAKDHHKAVLLLSRSDWRKGFDIAETVVGRVSGLHSDIFEVWTVGEPCSGIFPDIVHRDFGYVGEERLRRIMSSADLFLYPTRHEGFGLMPLEAFACGCPVVTTEVVTFASHLQNALVAKVENVERLAEFTVLALNDASLLESIISQGVITAKRLSIEKTKEQFASAINSIVARGQR